MSTRDDNDDSMTKEPLRGKDGNINATATKGNNYSASVDEKALKRKKYIKWGIIGGIILIAVILAIVLPITLSKKSGGGGNGPTPQPIANYNPYHADPKDVTTSTTNFEAIIRAPKKYSPAQHLQSLENIIPVNADGTKKLAVDSQKIPVGPNNLFAQNVKMSMDMINWRVAHLTLTDNDNARYSIPEMSVNKPKADQTMRLDMLGFEYNLNPFSISFNDPANPDNVLLTTKDQSLVFMDKFIQMDFKLPSQRLFGLGERIHDFQLDEGTWTMWAIGLDSPEDDGTGRKGVYGVHPFVMVQTQTPGDFIGIFFRNSNAQSPVIKYNADGTSILSYLTTGGQVEVYFFIHGKAKDIISQYQQMFGKPNLPPFWSLGWQQASWKYTTQDMVEDMIDKYAQAQMPLETVYLDIPYMDNFVDFTVNKKAFPKLQDLAKRLHDAGQRLVVIIDAAMSAEDVTAANKYYTQGNTDDIFIKSGIWTSTTYNNNLVSKVWPKTAVFVDWFNDKCMNMWTSGLYDLYNLVQYDGLWIDMNEPTTFQHGEIKPKDAQPVKPPKLERFLEAAEAENYDYNWYYKFGQSQQSTFDLPFVPGYNPKDQGSNPYTGNFDYMTLSLNATLPSIKELEYNVHSLYGHMMSMRTKQFLTESGPKPDERTFILTRSTFATTGQYASHWLGDNWRSWDYMKHSISGIMNMNMFGITQAGADVCGFFGEKKDDEMCARWVQLATFYPLARAHQNLTFNDKPSDFSEPYRLEGVYKDWARFSIRERFRYLRMMYTCMYETNQNGGTCFDPLFYHFPNDNNVYTDVSSTFIVGNAVKVSPVLASLDDKTTTFKSYFPAGTWVSLNNFASIITSKGQMVDLPAKVSLVHSHLKPGSLIPRQDYLDYQGQQLKTTQDLLLNPISIVANRDASGFASGTLFLDEGIARSEIDTKEYEYYTINHQAKSFQFQISAGTRGWQKNYADQLVIVNAADLKYTNFACYVNAYDNSINQVSFTYSDVQSTLSLNLGGVKFNQIQNVYYGGPSDLNLCSPASNQWRVPKGQALPALNVASASVELEHAAGILPNILVNLRVIETDIVNVNWNWKTDKDGKFPANKRVPFQVPNDIIDTDMDAAKSTLSTFIALDASPFKVYFKYRSQVDPSNVLTLDGMILDSYYNQIDVTVNTLANQDFQGIFGLGERANEDFFLKDGVYSMWSRDEPTPVEHGQLPASNMYGTHPYFMYKHKQNAWTGVLYKLANAQDWYVKNDVTNGKVGLTTKATGGVGDIYVMQGRTPDSVVSAYFRLIGNPVLVPQWALGWNQCRWGYKTVADLQAVVDGYDKNNMPLDVAWSDIDYLKEYRDFEFDPVNFADLPKFIDDLHKNNRKYVPILDAGIAYRPKATDKYPAFEDAQKDGLFITINGQNGKETLIGQVWPNDAAYPDFSNPKTTTWFQGYLDKLQAAIKFDGLWEDMNEASNFCKGACYQRQQSQNPVKNLLPYTPTGRDLELKSMPLDATHSDGSIQLDTHSLYGTQMVKASHEWFQKNNKRTFIIERSSFAGIGKFGSRWLGDNFSREQYMGLSVSGVMQMNMYGITLAGSDICGFIEDTTPELCAKWHTVGAFYPFSRNHNNWGQISQEPYVWGDKEYEKGVKYTDIMRNAIIMKYQLIRYYYTNLFQISTQGTGTFYKPMFFEFPNDLNAYKDITLNVMLGSALKLSVNSESVSQVQTNFYFPAGTWCDIIKKTSKCLVSTGQSVQMSSKVYEFGLHLRQGFIVPFQDLSKQQFKTSADTQNLPIELHILGDVTVDGSTNWRSQGVYVNDDGLTTDLDGNFNAYSFVSQNVGADKIQIQVFNTYLATNFADKVEKGCNAVNKNDFLQTLYIYNAVKLAINFNYKVTATLTTGGDALDLGTATFNADSETVQLTIATPVCMTKIQTILFTKQ